ncbi:MAG: MBG domain-containing protein, partial [Verrucomicrobiota bacterium]|nr:MBG domain-containing protein [Verrucomicrobiota bacterium]
MTHLSLDLRTGDRVSAGSEELTFSSLWDGDAEATVTIAQDGAAIFAGLSGEGVKTWTVDRNGRYELTHTTYNNGVAGKVETAVFVVEGKEVPVRELTIDWGQKSFVYDGQPKEPVITVKDRGTTLTKGTHYLVEYKDNINVGTAKAIVKGIEPYVEEVTNTFTITKGSLPDDVDPDPIKPDPTKPDEPYSAFDSVGVYDGEGHTIDTNGLAAAYRAAVGAGFAVSYAVGESGGLGQPATPWSAVAPVFTNAATNVVWYKVSSANYEDIVHPAKVTIAKREVTVTSADGSWTYDGQAHSNATVMCEGFVSGEGIVANNFATITDVGSVANAFTYAFADGTLAGNYLVTCVTGTLTISEAYKAFVIRCEWIEDAIRPATMDFMVQTNGVDWQIENVTAVDEWKRVTDVKVYDQGVSVDYGLVALPAEGIRSEIEQLGCRTVGSLSGLDNVLTESGWSNVGSSTINTVVGTVDGWRRFGELRMSDLVIAEDTSKGVFFKVCNFKSTFDIDDGTDGMGGEASRFSYSGVYDGVGHGIGVEVANAPSGMTVKYARGNAGTPPSDGWSAVNPLFTNVCDRAVVWYAVECAGYVPYTNSATVTISPKWVIVRADAKSRPYGQPDVPLTYTAEGLVAGDALGGALSRDPGEAAGTYSIRQGTLANANYAISYIGADYVIAKVSINPTDVFGGNGSEENLLVCEKVYDGSAQSVEIKPNFDEEYGFLWSLTKGDESSYSETAPTLRNVADGELTVYFKFVTENYEPYYGKVIFRILPKTLTDEMVQLTDEAFFFDPESGQKTPSVTVADTNSFGTVISTAADYDVAYGDSTSSAGAVPVTV